jgi:hypothetical protein
MPIRRTSNKSSYDSGFYNPEVYSDVGSRRIFEFDSNALTYINAVEAADGQALELNVKLVINDFVVGCKADGIWDAIKASCILAGARTLPGALVPLVGSAPTDFNFWGDADPNWAAVSLLLRMNGANASTTFTDSSSNALTVTAVGNAQISTAQSKFGGSSALFDGNGDYLQLASNTNFSFDADFTVEFWIRQASSPTETFPIVLERGSGTEAAGAWGVIINNSGATKQCEFFYGGPRSYVSIGALAFDTWHFVTVSRSGSTLKTFIDGVQTSSVTVTDNLTITATLRVGSSGFASPSNFFKGNVDDLRITKGVARYTAAFTPPILTFPGSTSDYDRETGLVGDGSTKYLNSNRAGNADPQDNHHLSVFATLEASGTMSYIGPNIYGASGESTSIYRNNNAPARLDTRSRNVSQNSGPSTASRFLGFTRSASGSYTARVSGTDTSHTVFSISGAGSESFLVFARNTSPISLYADARLSFYSIGESLNLALLDNRVTVLMSGVQNAIP